MDVDDHGAFHRMAAKLGRVVETSALEEDLERQSLALHVERAGAPDLVVAASAFHDDVLAMLTDEVNAHTCLVAARVLVNHGELGGGRVVTLPPGSARGVRGSTGAFATFDARDVGELPSWVKVFAVHAPRPLSEWEEATLDEARSAVPGLLSRFARRPKPGQAAAKPAGRRTMVRRRDKS